MKTERFDEIIRKKLEAVYQGADASEVDRVFRKVSGYTAAVKISRLKRTLYLSSTALVVMGVAYWGWMERRANLALREEIAQIKQAINTPLSQAPELPTSPKTPATLEPSSNSNPLIQSSQQLATPSHLLKQPFEHQPTQSPNATQQPNRTKETTSQAVLNPLASAELLPVKSFVFNCVTDQEPIRENAGNDLPDPSEWVPQKQKKPIFPQLMQHTRVFASGNIGPEQKGSSVGIDYLITNRITVSTGIQYTMQREGLFRDDHQYRERTGKGFQQVYGENVNPDSMKLMKIAISNRLLQVPVALTYNLPVTHGLWFTLSGQSNLNLYSSQELHFICIPRPGMPPAPYDPERNIERPFSPGLFNNAQVSIGMEKRWSKLFIGTSAGLDWYWKRSAYTDDRMLLSLKLKVGWRLGS